MSALYGRLRGELSRRVVTRRAFTDVWSELSTRTGRVETTLYRDGRFEVATATKYGSPLVIFEGSVPGTETHEEPSDGDYTLTWLDQQVQVMTAKYLRGELSGDQLQARMDNIRAARGALVRRATRAGS